MIINNRIITGISSTHNDSKVTLVGVKDKPGVLSEITNRLAKYKISVKRLIQTPDKKNNKATIVIITHKTTDININKCLYIFKKNKNILKTPTLIRLLG